MRSRTELVTTTFVDSDDDDFSEDDDSEEDWRPNKKRQQKQSRASGGGGSASSDSGGRKRRAAVSTAVTRPKRRVSKVNEDDFESAEEDEAEDDELVTEPSDDDEYEDALDYAVPSTSAKRAPSLPPKKQYVKLTQLELMLNKRDILSEDWLQNNRLCLWRKDTDTNLLQKYLRVKITDSQTAEQQQQAQKLIFTSSSVYSSWDEQHISDFITIKVNCLDTNNRRVQLDNLQALQKIANELQSNQKAKAEVTDPDQADVESLNDGQGIEETTRV